MKHKFPYFEDTPSIHKTAVIYPGVKIGRWCRISANVTVGAPGFGYEKDERGEWQWRDHPYSVVIGDNVDIGAGTVIDAGRYRHTMIGDGTKIDANVFIAHNCLIGKRCLIIANSQISGSCEIGDDCHIGPAAALTDHVKVGDGARCGMNATVLRDVPAGVTVVNPGGAAEDIELRRKGKGKGGYVGAGHPAIHGGGGGGGGFTPQDLPLGREICGIQYANHGRRWICARNVGHEGNHRSDDGTWFVWPPQSVEHPGSHGDIRTPDWDAAFGDGCEFSLPVPRPDHSELGQRQRAAVQGWMKDLGGLA